MRRVASRTTVAAIGRNVSKPVCAQAAAAARVAAPQIQRRNFTGLEDFFSSPEMMTTTATVVPIALGAVFALGRYKVSKPDQYLVRTGLGISDIKISKTGMQWPFQIYNFIDLTPKNYSFKIQSMSSQMMEFVLPGVFTIGPRPDKESLQKYAQYLMNDNHEDGLDDLVRGIIEGETRLMSSQMTIEEIFNNRTVFKSKILENIQPELDQFGLQIFNANIKELEDAAGSEFFSFRRQKTRSEAEAGARIDISENKKAADVGEKDREAETRKQVAEFESAAVLKENDAKKRIAESTAELAIIEAEARRQSQIANVEADKQTSMRDQELEKEVQSRKYLEQVESYKATDLSKANIEAEAIRVTADAALYKQEKEAEGILRVYEAQSKGIEGLIESFGNDREKLIQYLMLDKGLYPELARTNAEAIKGLNPKITVWNTGNDNKDPIRNLMQSIPPLFTTIHDQTGLKPGDWLMNGFEKNTPQKVKDHEVLMDDIDDVFDEADQQEQK